MSHLLRGLLAAALLLASPALADQTIVKRVAFKDGRATLKGSVKGYDSVDYVFPAGAGESIRISLKPGRGLSNYFNLTAPGAAEALHIGSTSGNDFAGAAPVAGDYTARVYLMRNDARRGKVANFTLTIVVGATSASNEKGPDFADGLTGGPDFWEVAGVAAGDALALRATPSPKGALVTKIGNGAQTRNLGCKNTRGQRWCRIEAEGGARGWANGRYLRESAISHPR